MVSLSANSNMSRTVCVTVCRGKKNFVNGLLIDTSSTSSLEEVLKQTHVVLADDDTVVVKCATSDTGKQYDAES